MVSSILKHALCGTLSAKKDNFRRYFHLFWAEYINFAFIWLLNIFHLNYDSATTTAYESFEKFVIFQENIKINNFNELFFLGN